MHISTLKTMINVTDSCSFLELLTVYLGTFLVVIFFPKQSLNTERELLYKETSHEGCNARKITVILDFLRIGF